MLVGRQPELEALHCRQRAEMVERVAATFRATGAEPILIGSICKPKPDLFCDIDVWVECPDEETQRIIDERAHTYACIGDVLLCWERPRFAPLGGIHSVVMYNSTTMPIELDVFMASREATRTTYAGIVTQEPSTGDKQYPWETAADNVSAEERLDYLLCVSYWTMKYISRGQHEKLDWFASRYQEVQAYFPGMPDLPAMDADLDEPMNYIKRTMLTLQRHIECPRSQRRIAGLAQAANLGSLVLGSSSGRLVA